MSSTESHPISDRFEKMKDRLARLRDQLVVRNHLAGLEIKDAVSSLSKELEKVSTKINADLVEAVGAATDEARVQGHLGLLELKQRVELLESALKKGLRGAIKEPTFLAETAQLQLALARMDAEQAIHDRAKELRQRGHALKHESAEMLKDLEHKIEQMTAEAAKYV
jgi:predicted  nucleic acid-binding Zn-ribbon protein